MWIAGALVILATAALIGCSADGGDRAEVRAGASETVTPRTSSEDREQSAIQLRLGIAGVRLGMAPAKVKQALGSPDATQPSELHPGWIQWIYRDPRMRVTLEELDEHKRVWDVRTYARDHRAPGDVGVGSTEREVREALPRVRCRPYGGPARYSAWRVCADTQTYMGPFTSFTIVDGRVRYVTVASGLAQ